MKKIEKMNQLLADLTFLNVKFHNIHWNVVGPNFQPVHEFTEQVYDDFFLKYDEIAERLKMLGHYPHASITTYAKNTNISELEDKDYTVAEVLNIILESFEYLVAEFIEIRLLAEEENDFITVAMMEEYLTGLDKNIWFVRSMTK